MPQYKFTGGYSAYYPDSGLFTKPGEVHTLDSAPDDRWAPVDGSVAPVAAPAVNDAPAPQEPQANAVAEAEALIEANPALAAKLVEEAKANA